MPVWRELVADTLTPVAAFLQIVDRRPPPGSCSSRSKGASGGAGTPSSGRNPLATITARGHQVTTGGRLDLDAATGGRVTGDRGVLAALEAILDAFDSPDLPDLPPLHAGLVGYLGYDVVREVEHLPDIPPDDLGQPDACWPSSASWPPSTTGASGWCSSTTWSIDPAWGDRRARRRP